LKLLPAGWILKYWNVMGYFEANNGLQNWPWPKVRVKDNDMAEHFRIQHLG